MDVEVRYIDDSKGNGLFAKKNFSEDSILFEESPLVCVQFSWNAEYGYKACDHCLKPLETAEENVRRLTGKTEIVLPYPEFCTTNKSTITQCSGCGVEYCNADCQEKAFNQYHRTLCVQTGPLQCLNDAWKQIHYPPETGNVMLIPRILATIQQSCDKENTLNRFLKFCHRSVNDDSHLAHKLLGEKFANQISTLHSLLVQSMPHEHVSQLLSPEGFQSLLALMGTNGQGVATSPFSQWVENVPEKDLVSKLYEDMDANVGSFLDNEGVGLFETQSAANHSCLPNAEIVYRHNNSTLSLRALRDIEAGEEICISYVDECTLSSSRHSRQKELRENYLFNCNCPKCLEQADDPDVTSDEDMSDSDE